MHVKLNVTLRSSYIAPDIITFMLGLLSGRAWLCGGAIRSYLNCEPVSDYDIVFADSSAASQFKSFLERTRSFRKAFECPEGKLTNFAHRGTKIQLITDKFYTGPEAIIESFDFTICQFVFDGNYLYTTSDALRDTRHKLLVVNKLQYPAASLGRIQKFLNRGYKFGPGFKSTFIAESSGRGVLDDTREYID